MAETPGMCRNGIIAQDCARRRWGGLFTKSRWECTARLQLSCLCILPRAAEGTRLILRVISPGHSGYPLENSRGRESVLGQLVSQGLLEFKQKAVARVAGSFGIYAIYAILT